MDVWKDIDDLAQLAASQSGRVRRGQLAQVGIGRGQIDSWVKRGILIPRLPSVFAVGYASTGWDSRLWEAVLYAGPGAMVCHMSAAQWCDYIKYGPPIIHVSTPRKVKSIPGVAVHGRRILERTLVRGVPVTLPEQVMLDLAVIRPDLLPRALGQLDFQKRMNMDALYRRAASGDPGSRDLRAALDDYDPAYARLNDEFEVDFYALCQSWQVDPLPLPNVEVAPQLIVDGLWPEHHLAVELDGKGNHSSDGQLLRDAERDLICRSLGLTVIRYRRAQIQRSPDRVRIDLLGQLERNAPGRRVA